MASDVRWTARFGLDSKVQSYRAFKRKWHATPGSNPTLVVVVGRAGSSGFATTGYVSWNGATDVTAWEIWAGPSKKKLSKVGRVKYRGFETKFGVPGTCALAVALEGRKAVRKSNVACVDQ